MTMTTHSSGRIEIKRAVILAIISLTVALSASLRADAPTRPVEAVASIGLSVSDLDRSVDFYRDVLTFEPGDETETADGRTVPLRLEDETLIITQPRVTGRPVPEDSRSNDLWFQHVAIVVRDMDVAYARLQRFDVAHVSPEPQRLPDWNPAAGGIRAFYFRDPDGHVLELIQIPPGEGNRRWHEPTDRLFLGIDHTAIAVADTERSLWFYRDRLGLGIAGTSENFGPEQERLNNVPAAHLRITALRASAGPGVELLEYLSPRGGRPFPENPSRSDIFHWHITMATSDPDDIETTRAVSSLRDPDGHAVEIIDWTTTEQN